VLIGVFITVLRHSRPFRQIKQFQTIKEKTLFEKVRFFLKEKVLWGAKNNTVGFIFAAGISHCTLDV
jgi:hypothetical protein